MGWKNTIGKALMIDSERAVKYLGSGAKGAERIKNAATLAGKGHNEMIRARQYKLGARYAMGGGAVGGMIMANKRRAGAINPMSTPKGSGRYV